MTVNKHQIGRRAAELATGFLAWSVVDHAFDYVLYPFVIWKLGLWRGGLLMSVLSLLYCLLLLRFYDHLGRDWLGIEFVKGLRVYEGSSRWRRWIAWLIVRSDWIAFLVLSLHNDPFITTTYLRHGAYNGMTARDWRIFMGSWVLANTAWIVICFGGVQALVWAWRRIVG